MRWLLFLSRLAFICGFFMLLSISLLIKDWTTHQVIISIIFAGYAMALVLIPATVILYPIIYLIKKRIKIYVPAWLITANIFFLVILILYIFYFNDPYYHQK